eukprot:1153147-Pelagomonas_calceolata.AAC.1
MGPLDFHNLNIRRCTDVKTFLLNGLRQGTAQCSSKGSRCKLGGKTGQAHMGHVNPNGNSVFMGEWLKSPQNTKHWNPESIKGAEFGAVGGQMWSFGVKKYGSHRDNLGRYAETGKPQARVLQRATTLEAHPSWRTCATSMQKLADFGSQLTPPFSFPCIQTHTP